MAKKVFSDEIPVKSDRFFEDVILNDELTSKMYLEGLGFQQWEVVSRTEEDGKIVREVDVTPPQNIPSFMKKFIKGKFSYKERVIWQKGSDSCTVETIPNVMSDKIDIATTIKVEPMDENRCRRIMEVEIKVRIPLIGGKIENHVLGEVEGEFRRSGDYLRNLLG